MTCLLLVQVVRWQQAGPHALADSTEDQAHQQASNSHGSGQQAASRLKVELTLQDPAMAVLAAMYGAKPLLQLLMSNC